MLRPYDTCASNLLALLKAVIFAPVAHQYPFDLAIFNLANFMPVARYFRFDLAIFAQVANLFCLDLLHFWAGARYFC